MQKDCNRQEVLSEDNGYACKGEEEECGQMLKMSSCWEIVGRQEDGRARSRASNKEWALSVDMAPKKNGCPVK